MSLDDTIKAVRTAYEAFGRSGDVPALLDLIHDDCDCGVEASAQIAPYSGSRHGTSEILAFFQERDLPFTVGVADIFAPLGSAGVRRIRTRGGVVQHERDEVENEPERGDDAVESEALRL